jgi:hypothetical protein
MRPGMIIGVLGLLLGIFLLTQPLAADRKVGPGPGKPGPL